MTNIKMLSKKKCTQIYRELEDICLQIETVGDLQDFQKAVRAACAKGFPIDHKPYGVNRTLLNLVVENVFLIEKFQKHIHATISLLLKLGANIDNRNDQGQTPLLFCRYADMYNRFIYLLKHGADPNICDNNNDNALMYFLNLKVYESDVSRCPLEDLQEIVNRITDINHVGDGFSTAIGLVCDSFKEEIPSRRILFYPIIKILLNAGADPYIDDYWSYNTERLNEDAVTQEEFEHGISELQAFFAIYFEQKENLKHSRETEYDYML